jgi:hypothetical protein
VGVDSALDLPGNDDVRNTGYAAPHASVGRWALIARVKQFIASVKLRKYRLWRGIADALIAET